MLVYTQLGQHHDYNAGNAIGLNIPPYSTALYDKSSKCNSMKLYNHHSNDYKNLTLNRFKRVIKRMLIDTEPIDEFMPS